MKNLVKYTALVLMVLGLSACVKDLNTKPIDPNSSTSFNQERMFTKCYACLAVIGQSGPGEDSDVEDLDAGTSGFYRMIWYCNDLPADEAWWIWKDPEQPEVLQTATWTGETKAIPGIYTRLNLDVKYCNHYLAYASQETDEEKYRYAEVRFIRALHYYHLMDMFLYAPLITTESNEYPHFKPRHELYAWLVDELKDLEIELPAQRVTKYRVGKAAAQLLLARIYLNADVYNKYNPNWTKGQTWDLAYKTATAVINDNPQHQLVTTPITTDSGFVYSAYQRLFMGDNDRDDVMKESLLQIYQDGLYSQSYASTLYLIAGPRIAGLNAWGIESEWHALRTSPTLVDKFLTPMNIDRSTAEDIVLDEFKMPSRLHDDRAILCSDSMDTGYKFLLTGSKGSLTDPATVDFFDCWGGMKFTGVYSSASLPKLSPRQSTSWPDTDIPFFRLAEAYMIQAEALFRKGNVSGALDIINNVIRKRANADPLPSLDEETLLDEWCREFWFEGRRRIDLIRFGRFFGNNADKYRYNWEGRLGVRDGQGFFVSNSQEYLNWFPVPSIDKRANPNFKTDVEGDPHNTFASQGGDGYVY